MLRAILLISVIFMLAACSGGGAKTTLNQRMTTTGQELVDLKRAYDEGAISEREYQEQRTRILKKD